ncbi:hypothetical protein EDD18DRAFT_1100457 [Armillaria luteobubalina]|uniref:Uncharacterized protein n=1 Tax=Armillaria luteobubalina TaxID=153913 RepID=A0AA39USW5_9AGAR|nr:hypothetical protein EDD18DRAFT_1100457 [Armillaria luteobubalina]
MSLFVDLEAGVDRQEVLESSDEEVDDFIEDADNEDDTSDAVDAPTADPSAVTPLPGQSEVEEPWTELLDRARMRATRGPTVGERHDDVSIHDVPPEFCVLTIFDQGGFHDAAPREARMVSKVYPWGCKVLLVPRLDPSARNQKNRKQRRLDKLAPKLFDRGAVQLDGTEKVKVVKKTEERYLWHGFVYEHDLLVHRVNFSQVELAREIPDVLAGLFCQSCHPLVRRHRKHLPRISEWCLVVGDPVMDTSNGKTFEVGQYVEMTDELIDQWAGWIDAIEDGLIHVVSRQTRTKDEVKMREVHPNLLMASTPPLSLPPAPKKDQEFIRPTKNISWKGTLVTITRPHHRWRGKTGYVEDVNVLNNSYNRPGLRVLIRSATYDPNMPYPDTWFDYLDVVDEETHLPLNEALPLADNDDNLYHKYVPVTHFLEERGRRRLHGYKFRAIYHGLKISAAACANSISGGGLKCIRDDTLAREELDPAAVLPIHPTSRHYDLFLVISGEHCGKWVRGIQFKKGTSQDRSDLEWTVMVIIPRAPYLQDDLTDERLVLHSSCMTLADESAQERKLNDSLKRLLRKPARER